MISRRKFTEILSRLRSRRNSGQSVAEVARALEVHPSDLHRWRRELQITASVHSAGRARSAPKRVGWLSWNERSANRPWLLPFLDPEKPAPADMDLDDEIQKIALEWPSDGSRRITRELKPRGWEVNRKRVQRLMREDNLLCVVVRGEAQVRGHD